MNSEVSCDAEDWSNDALHHRNTLLFQIYSYTNQLFSIVIIFQNILVFYCIIGQINSASVSIRDFSKKKE